MKMQEMFGAAQFVSREDKSGFAVLRGHFNLKKKGKATLRVAGLGFFTCYVNGKKVSDDRFLPLFTDYEARDNYPSGEVLTGHRLYVPEYDISDLVVRRIRNALGQVCIAACNRKDGLFNRLERLEQYGDEKTDQ